MVPTRNQITAQIQAVLEREPQARCIAIRSPGPDEWPESVTVRERRFRLHWCESPLVARQSLLEAETNNDEGVVILTNLGDSDLGCDVLARLSRARVFQVESWDMLRQLFQAREVDSRLARQGWIASALLDHAPPEGYPPVPGGFLDLDTAWKHILQGCLGISDARPDAVALLHWAMSGDGIDRFAKLQDNARPHVIAWLSDAAGSVGEFVMGCVAAGNGFDALAIGLVCDVVFAQTDEGQSERAAAAVRLERFTGERRIGVAEGRRWAEAAAWVARSADNDAVRPFLERADALLGELHLIGQAGLSSVLPSGFEARLVAFGNALRYLVAKPTADALADVERAASAVLSHHQGQSLNARSERVQMALRLSRWLVSSPTAPSGFAAHARTYAFDGAFVDWARLKLLGGDELAVLSSAYAALAEAVRGRREAFSKQFADALKAWNADGPVGDECLPVEAVLSRLVGPLAHQECVLLLVVDGLSHPIYRELCEDLERNGWNEFIPKATERPRVGIAALPTVTEVSRASLLAGQLACGASGFEKSAFAANAALLAASKASGKPIVFHKGELGDTLGLSQEVRDAIGKRERRVVAVVYNAVDDHLSGSDQLHLRWSLDDLRLLKPLLHEARAAGRVLIVTSDHGHVIDENTYQRGASDGDRWRSYDGPVQEDEILLADGRVQSPTGATRVVCAWSERLRYSGKKNGYHGGASPQEVIVPLGVFVSARVSLQDWKPAPPLQPDWWETRISFAPVAVTVPSIDVKPKKPKEEKQPDLFRGQETVVRVDWIGSLLATAIYAQQRQLAARVAPQDQEMRYLLQALDERGGKLSKAILAQKLGIPLVRVSGFVNAARRVLNVDQFPVLSLDEGAGMVEFNRELLDVQFQLKVR